MTPEQIRERVDAWWPEEAPDNESAHIAEDALLHDVLTAIAEGTATDPAACAREAIRMREADYDRWYA